MEINPVLRGCYSYLSGNGHALVSSVPMAQQLTLLFGLVVALVTPVHPPAARQAAVHCVDVSLHVVDVVTLVVAHLAHIQPLLTVGLAVVQLERNSH